MQRSGLNRHRRGYVTKERVQRHVPFLVPGPIGLARSQFLNLILSSLLSSSVFPSHNRYHHILNPITRECQKHSTSTDTIALRRAYDPYILVIREFKELDKQILLMQLGIKQLP